MNKIYWFFLLLFPHISPAQTLEKLWETAPNVAVPESVLVNSKDRILYISLIDGGAWEADGKGGIARMNLDGTGYDSTWVTGLHAPKGMALYKNRLYVADINNVVVINTKNTHIEKKIPIDSAVALNDVTVTDNGTVYVSDSRTARVWQLVNDVPLLYLEGLQGVNGLKAVGSDLIIASGKNFLKVNASKKTDKVADLPQGGDGIEPVGNGAFLVTSWSGYIYYVSSGGEVKTLLETTTDKKNAADMGYDPKSKILYVPTFYGRTVSAYQLHY